jgi:hypothetical protein
MRVSRALVALASPLFAAVAVAIWLVPDQAALMLGLEPVNPRGAAVIRADLGGLFAGVSLLCAIAAWTQSSPWSHAAAAIFGAVVAGRALGWVGAGRIGSDIPDMLIELTLLAALASLARSSAARPVGSTERRVSRRTVVLAFQPSLVDAIRGADVLISEAIAVEMTRALGRGASGAGRESAAAIMHDIEDCHITPQQAASLANDAGVKLLVFYHLLPAPDGALPRRVFAQGIDEARRGDWTLADDGRLYTLPIGSDAVRIGGVVE